MIDPVRNPFRHGGRAVSTALAALACAGAAQSAPQPPDYVSAAAQVRSLLTGQILPPSGTTFSFLATLEWSGPSTSACPVGTDCIVNIIDHLNRDGFVAMDNSLYYDTTDPSHQLLPGSQRIQEVWTYTGPSSFTIDEQLYLSAQVDANEGTSARFVADLSHTGHFYLDPITPGATYTTASGRTYFMPSTAAVPESSSWALYCSGLLAVGTLIRRRQTARGQHVRAFDASVQLRS